MLKIQKLMKQRTAKQNALKQARAKRKKLRETETELQAQIDALEEITPELEEQVDANAEALAEVEDTVADLQDEIDELTAKIEELEDEPPADEDGDEGTRSARARRAASRRETSETGFRCRSRCFRTRAERDSFYARSDVHDFLEHVRSLSTSAAAAGRRSVTGAELAIPEVILDIIRNNVGEYSKLIKYVRLRKVKGKSRQLVTGDVPPGIWTEMKGILNELEFGFTAIELDGFKVGGYIPVDNYVLMDSDIDLGEEIVVMLLQSIGLGYDLSVPYGKGRDSHMPVGFVTRLAQTAEPSYWRDEQGVWTDLHTSNVLTLNLVGLSGEAFFQPLIAALGKADPRKSNGVSVWIMNRKTHMDLLARGLAFNSAGALVAGLSNAMPVENGVIVEMEEMADYDIVGGFLDMYLSAEREGGTFARSEHRMFVEDKTLFKATARYDGQPIRGEAFVALNYNNTAPVTSYDFSTDYANDGLNTLIVTAAAGTASGDTALTVAGKKSGSNKIKYLVQATTADIKAGMKAPADYTELPSNSNITAATGTPVAVIEVDSKDKVVSIGNVTAVAKT